jgi:hypothetical protein
VWPNTDMFIVGLTAINNTSTVIEKYTNIFIQSFYNSA